MSTTPNTKESKARKLGYEATPIGISLGTLDINITMLKLQLRFSAHTTMTHQASCMVGSVEIVGRNTFHPSNLVKDPQFENELLHYHLQTCFHVVTICSQIKDPKLKYGTLFRATLC